MDFIIVTDNLATTRLRQARLDDGFHTAMDFVREHGLNEVTYRSHENGSRGFGISTAKKYAKLLNCNYLWLLSESNLKDKNLSEVNTKDFISNQKIPAEPAVKKLKNYQDLEVWQKAIDLTVTIYKATESFPKHEMYGLTSQIRRASFSIPSHIAEGSSRQSSTESIKFVIIALGSLAELHTQIILSFKLGYLEETSYTALTKDMNAIERMLYGLQNALKNKAKQ